MLFHKLRIFISDCEPYHAGNKVIALVIRDCHRLEEIDNSGVHHKSSNRYAAGSIVFDKFEVLEFIDSGGKGSVYKVRDIVLNNIVALKVLLVDSKSEKALVRFQSEARTSSRLNHPNIAMIYDFGLSDRTPYISMEFVDGQSLKALCASTSKIALPLFLEIFIQVCEGLQHAHDRGIVHRDLKPDNIVVGSNAEGRVIAKILDFGVAKQIDVLTEESRLTPTGEIIGTPLFMSPEQAGGQSVTRESDLYSLGCMMWFCLTGQPPLSAESAMETLILHQRVAPPSLAAAFADLELPKQLCDCIDALLSKEQKLRPSLKDVLANLIAVREMENSEPVQLNVPASTVIDTTSASVKSSVWILLPAVGLVLVCGAFFVYVILPQFKNVESSVTGRGWENPPDITEKGKEFLDKTQNQLHVQKQLVLVYECTDAKLETIKLGDVEKIDLSHSPVTDKAFEFLAKAPHLSELKLSATDVRTLIGIEKLKGLEWLALKDTKTNDASLDPISKLKKLRVLELSDTEITNAAFSKLALIPNLEVLNLNNTNVSGERSEPLRALKKLTWIKMNGSNANKKGVAELASLPAIDNIETGACLGLKPAEVMELRNRFPCIKIGDEYSVLRTMELKAKDACIHGDMKSAIAIYNSCIDLVRKNYGEHSCRLLPLYQGLADCASSGQKYQLAKDALNKAASIARLIKDDSQLLSVVDKQCTIALDTMNFRVVEPMLDRGDRLAEQLGEPSITEKRCRNWGELCKSRRHYGRAVSYYQQWMKLHKPASDDADRLLVASILVKTGDCQRGINQTAQALANYTKAIGEFESINPKDIDSKSVQAIGYAGLAQIAINQNDYARGLEFNDKAFKMIEDKKLLPSVQAIVIQQRIVLLVPTKRTTELNALTEEYTKLQKEHPEFPALRR